MKMNKLLTILSFALPVSAFALTANDEASYTVDVPQFLTVSSPADAISGISGSSQSIQWSISSNNGVRINFSGSSYSDLGDSLSYPRFIKEDKDADGHSIIVDGKTLHDNLDTSFGLAVSGHESIQHDDHWGGGTVPTGTGDQLILALGEASSPDVSFGRIMPSDAGSDFYVDLHAIGTSDANDQSGDYALSVTLVATASEV